MISTGHAHSISSPPAPTANLEGRERYSAIDFCKAAAVIAVAFQHAGHPKFMGPWDSAEIALRQAWTAFHVPTFIAVSGFLYYRPRAISISGVASRLGRLWLPYAIASLVVIALASHGVHVPPAVRFLSDASLGIFLYHHILQLLLLPRLQTWPPAGRVVMLAAAGLIGSSLLCLLGRRMSRVWSRRLLGA